MIFWVAHDGWKFRNFPIKITLYCFFHFLVNMNCVVGVDFLIGKFVVEAISLIWFSGL